MGWAPRQPEYQQREPVMTETVRYTLLAQLVVDTFIVHRGREHQPSHYEIHLATEPNAPRAVYITDDAALYESALAIEGTEHRVDAAWRPGRRPNGKTAQLLVAIRQHREAA